jgi:hypothetical protein
MRYTIEHYGGNRYRVYDCKQGTIASNMSKQDAEAFCKLKNDMEPKTVNILGYELPLPENKAPNIKAEIFILDTEAPKGYRLTEWVNVAQDRIVLKNRCVFLHEQDAHVWAKFWHEAIVSRIKEAENG